ncbi:phospholipid scramblase 2-like [Protopterus annectens]|uniref:phospholipid scramblase 2-like n=1 Tax=Protopterus annectens TaxID=7888 RepID=UPI001CFAD33F|nr:phospholipid scramblase 2-like [Protopterus annectens]XP_043926050.1 phospholipid scramblase 2-like [Protopterus annectens]
MALQGNKPMDVAFPGNAFTQQPPGQPHYATGVVNPAFTMPDNSFVQSQYPAGPQYGPAGQMAYGVPGQGLVAAIPNQLGSPVVQWMPLPPPSPDCPPGLEYLSQIDQLLVHQQIELLEILTGFETNNKYEIKNSMGQRVYFAAEENDCCTRNCCGPGRPFSMKIIDNTGREVISLNRPCRCSSCLFPCCLQELEVQAPPGVTVGYVAQQWHPCLPKFSIQNERKEDMLKITGPCVVCSCCSDIDFEVKSLDETSVVGKITKQWTGFVKEAFTDADNFGIQFPMDLSVKMKAVMLGACFLVDYMFFEQSGGSDRQRAGIWQF